MSKATPVQNTLLKELLQGSSYNHNALGTYTHFSHNQLLDLLCKEIFDVEYLTTQLESFGDSLNINTTIIVDEEYVTILDLAEDYMSLNLINLLEDYGAIGVDLNLRIKIPWGVEINDSFKNALAEYFTIFGNFYNLESKTSLENYCSVKNFSDIFNKSYKLAHFVNFVQQDERFNSHLVHQFDMAIERTRSIDQDIIPQVTPDEGEILTQYLMYCTKNVDDLSTQNSIKEELIKLDNEEYHKINLSHTLYDSLLNYCVLHLNDNNEDDANLFTELLCKVGIFGLNYTHGDNIYYGGVKYDLTPLATAIYAKTSSANQFAYILALHGYGTERPEHYGESRKLEDCKDILDIAVDAQNIKLLEILENVPGVDTKSLAHARLQIMLNNQEDAVDSGTLDLKDTNVIKSLELLGEEEFLSYNGEQ